MKPMRLAVVSTFATLAIWIAAGSSAHAYGFWWQYWATSQNPNVVSIYMHTVSFFCSDVHWSGVLKPNGSLILNSAGGCLVDRVEATDASGRSYVWYGSGLPGASFTINPHWPDISAGTPPNARRKLRRH